MTQVDSLALHMSAGKLRTLTGKESNEDGGIDLLTSQSLCSWSLLIPSERDFTTSKTGLTLSKNHFLNPDRRGLHTFRDHGISVLTSLSTVIVATFSVTG